jgi:asparagine synthetase B (glutamine-hydrolysing)
MLTNKEISMYLKYGFTNEFSYGEPITIDHSLSFDDCVQGYKELYEKSLNELYTKDVLCALSGGLDSTLNALYVKDDSICYCYIIEGNLDHSYAKKVAKEWGLKRFFLIEGIDINNIEEDLILMTRLWKKPRCITSDLHTYDMMLKAKRYSDIILTGKWAEIICLGFAHLYGPFIESAYVKGEYDISLATSIFDSRCGTIDHEQYFNIDRAVKNKNKSYSDILADQTYFPCSVFYDHQIRGFGFDPPNVKLREESLPHVIQAIYDWFHPCVIGKRYSILEDNAGIKCISPFEKLKDFCLSMPYEYKFCMGIEKYVMRKFILDHVPDYFHYLLHRKKEGFQSHTNWWDLYYNDVLKLMYKYLGKGNIIYDYLDYDYFEREFDNFSYYQKFVLLNLSIWMNLNV